MQKRLAAALAPLGDERAQRAFFAAFDHSGDGDLDKTELKTLIRRHLRVSEADLTDASIYALVKALDDDGSGSLSIDELLDFVKNGEPEVPHLTRTYFYFWKVTYLTNRNERRKIEALGSIHDTLGGSIDTRSAMSVRSTSMRQTTRAAGEGSATVASIPSLSSQPKATASARLSSSPPACSIGGPRPQIPRPASASVAHPSSSAVTAECSPTRPHSSPPCRPASASPRVGAHALHLTSHHDEGWTRVVQCNVAQPFGVTLAEEDEYKGVEVLDVTPESQASAQHVQSGWRLLQVGGVDVNRNEDVLRVMSACKKRHGAPLPISLLFSTIRISAEDAAAARRLISSLEASAPPVKKQSTPANDCVAAEVDPGRPSKERWSATKVYGCGKETHAKTTAVAPPPETASELQRAAALELRKLVLAQQRQLFPQRHTAPLAPGAIRRPQSARPPHTRSADKGGIQFFSWYGPRHPDSPKRAPAAAPKGIL